jgi:hypothetical protein
VSLCTKFDKNLRRKTCFVDILLSVSILTGHIQPLAGHVRTRPDISGPKVGHIWSFRTALLRLMSTPHGFFTGLLYLVPTIPIMFSLLFHPLSSRQWLAKVTRGVLSDAKRSVALAQVGATLLTRRSLPRSQDPTLSERSPPPRTLILMVALPTPSMNLSA